jgi:hypothetical protein
MNISMPISAWQQNQGCIEKCYQEQANGILMNGLSLLGTRRCLFLFKVRIEKFIGTLIEGWINYNVAKKQSHL